MTFCSPTTFPSSSLHDGATAAALRSVTRFKALIYSSSLACAAAASVLFASGAPVSGVAEPRDYRTDNYMSPVPATLKGATTVDAAALQRKLGDYGADVILIDVLPLRRKPDDFPPDRFWRTPPRHNIPDSVWLPNVGYGDIAPEFEAYFIENLERVTEGRKADKHLVFYCLKDCWMSWNAAKRALELGFANVSWFPGGTDEWEVEGYPLELSRPVKMPAFSEGAKARGVGEF